MRHQSIPREFDKLLRRFESCFLSQSSANFVPLVIGWVVCGGRRSISRVIEASGFLGARHFSVFYRFFSRAVWSPDRVSRTLVAALVERIEVDIEVAVDDTLCRRTGPHFFGAAMHHDGSASSKSSTGGRRPVFAFGHNWVVLSIVLPLPWRKDGHIAVPVMLRLYRSKSRCPETAYRKRTELAREMLVELRGMIPRDRLVLASGDSE